MLTTTVRSHTVQRVVTSLAHTVMIRLTAQGIFRSYNPRKVSLTIQLRAVSRTQNTAQRLRSFQGGACNIYFIHASVLWVDCLGWHWRTESTSVPGLGEIHQAD